MEKINECKELLLEGNIEKALEIIDILLKENKYPKDILYYMKGNAYRKMQNWQMAINSYSEAISYNPESPALQAREMIFDILNFYHKDLYNP